MGKTLLSIIGCFLFSFALFSFIKADNKNAAVAASSVKEIIVNKASAVTTEMTKEAALKAASAALYTELNLAEMGLSSNAMDYAYKGYEYLREKGQVNNNILTICDFSQNSKKKRLYIIDMDNRKILMNTYVAHGRNSGLDYANKFSNIPESLQSSLGFYVTKGTYHGKHGLSLKLDGKERGWNDNAEERAVVVHGADYIGDHRLGSAYMGRSFGCPAVPQDKSAKLINYIKNGSCLFIYHPSKSYLSGSKILNG